MFSKACVGYRCNGYEDTDDDYDDEEFYDGEARGAGGVRDAVIVRGVGGAMTGFRRGVAIAIGVVFWFGLFIVRTYY